jgi:hypothetical protein
VASIDRSDGGSSAMERLIVDAFTPLQCFVAGLVSTSLLGCVVWFLGWRYVVRMRAQDPDFFAKLTREAQRKKERKASLEEEGFHLRRREVELMERIVENQEVMIGLLRQSLEEKVVS